LSEEPIEDGVLKNTKFMVFTLLRILKYFYSFKQLEDRLGISSQVLWRYVTLRVTPEKQTAEKILAKINEEKLVEEIISRMLLARRSRLGASPSTYTLSWRTRRLVGSCGPTF
jgi:hypothetical protein